jgi:trk system potassium uptake protein TrkA
MRIVFVGASSTSILAARALLEKGYEVVLVDRDPEKIDQLQDEIDCGLLHGDGSRPGTLEEIGPSEHDILICLSDSDEANVLSALVGRSLGFGRVVPKIEDPGLEPICTELGLTDVIVPEREVAQGLVDLAEGRSNAALSTVVRSGLRFFAFTVAPEESGSLKDLKLPDGARAIARSRDDQSELVDDDTRLDEGDEVIVLAAESCLGDLQKRFDRGSGGEGAGES